MLKIDTHVFLNVEKDVWFQRHVHVYGSHYVAELTLYNVQDTWNEHGIAFRLKKRKLDIY
jgi:hypothetical protein